MNKSIIGLRFAQAFPEGYFSKDFDMEGAVVEATGRDWVIARTVAGIPRFQDFTGWRPKQIRQQVRQWCTEETEQRQ